MTYAVQNGLPSNYNSGNGLWNSRTFKDILSNITYTGDLRQGKNDIVVQNTHEAIISREDFSQAQTMLSSTNPKGNMTNVPRYDNMSEVKFSEVVVVPKCNAEKLVLIRIGISSLVSAIIDLV